MRTGSRWLAWMVATAASLVMLATPVGTQAQLAMSLAAMAAMLVLWLASGGLRARFVFLALGSLVVLRYMLWRVTSTIPPLADPVNFGFGVILLCAELYCVSILFVSLIVNADPLNRRAPARARDEDLPSVDVFVPSYNEDAAILAVTLAAAQRMDYPSEKLTVWLLDDGGTDQKCFDPDPVTAERAKRRRTSLRRLCADLGCRYLTRERNLHAKAGNLNNGLAHAEGDIVVVFDADHVPFRSFLTETIGYFASDPKLFLVQTPHAFLNPDPVERNLRTFTRMPSENEMFYAITQRGLDKWNGSFFCGSAALLRRRALDEAGGFSGITITEDCETAFELHARGWTSAYVDKPLIAGLQPNTLADFIGQRSRWCQGMLQILLLKNPLVKPGLKPIQRLGYLSSMAFWFFPLPRLIFMLAPLLHIFFDLKIFVASVEESIAYTATYVVINLMLQNYIYGKFRWPFVSELYEYIQGMFLFKAIVSVLISPRKPSFNVTAKGASLDQNRLSSLSLPFFVVWAVLLVGSFVAAWRYMFEPGVTDLMLVVGLWNLFNLFTAGAALGVCAERREAERTPSLAIRRRAALTLGGRIAEAHVDKVSAEGCTIRLNAAFLPTGAGLKPFPGSLSVAPVAGAVATGPLAVTLEDVSRQHDEATCRLAFGALDANGYAALAELMYGDARAMQLFQARRRRHKDLLTGTLQFAWWGLVEPIRAIRYAMLPSARPAAAAASAEIFEAPEREATAEPVTPVTRGRALVPAVPEVGFTERRQSQRRHDTGGPFQERRAASQSRTAAQPEEEHGGDWVRQMLEFENDRLLRGEAAKTGKAV